MNPERQDLERQRQVILEKSQSDLSLALLRQSNANARLAKTKIGGMERQVLLANIVQQTLISIFQIHQDRQRQLLEIGIKDSTPFHDFIKLENLPKSLVVSEWELSKMLEKFNEDTAARSGQKVEPKDMAMEFDTAYELWLKQQKIP